MEKPSNYISLEEAKKWVDDNKHNVNLCIDFIERNAVPNYPTRPTRPTLRVGATAAEALSYANSLQTFEDEMQKYNTIKSEIDSERKEVYTFLENYLKDISGLTVTVPLAKQDKVWRKAWEDGHSYGYREVYIHLESLVELFED